MTPNANMSHPPPPYMDSVICFIIAPFATHVLSSSGLARRLEQRGYKVQYWADSSVQSSIERQGFAFKPLPGMLGMRSPQIDLSTAELILRPFSTITKLRLRRQWRRDLGARIDDVEMSISNLIREVKPVLAIFYPFRLAYFPLF